ncbi:MAG: IPT/TIG domain-containing protein [Bryobacteraceae bacterium]
MYDLSYNCYSKTKAKTFYDYGWRFLDPEFWCNIIRSRKGATQCLSDNEFKFRRPVRKRTVHARQPKGEIRPMFNSYAYRFGALLLLMAPLAIAESVTVRSGNGSVGARDSAVTFLLGPADTDFSHPFTSTDFSSAQNGPAAFIVSRNASWISGLSVDSAASWIGTNANAASSQGNTALYAIRFTIANTFSTSSLTMHYAVDDSLGGTNPGVYLNGTAICNSLIENSVTNFTQEHILTCDGIAPLLHVGTNWFYIDAPNWEGAAGLLFSATITTSGSGVPSISPGGVVNAASSVSGAIAPGSIASAYGSFPLSAPSQASGAPLPISLSGLSMQFGGKQTPLYYASAGQVNLQVPWEVTGQTQATLTATLGGQTSVAQTVNLAPFAPGIFSMNGQGTGQGAILDSQYGLVGSSNPASVGDVIQIYCTGLGAVTNQPPTGFPDSGSPLSETTTTSTVTIGGASAQVLFSGLAPALVGLYQVNAQVPAGITTGPAVPVVVSIGGVASNTVTVAIQPFPPSPNPQPSITSLSPSSAGAGTGSLTLTISGSGFMASSSVTFNGVLHGASLVNSGQLTITLAASDLATAGSSAVVVSNPPPGGGSSNTALFTITPAPSGNPKPSITSLAPASAVAGSGALTLTINGSGFIASSSVTFKGVSHTASLVNSGQLNITLTASDLAVAGSSPVIVSNPSPGGGLSNTAYFSITTPPSPGINVTGVWQGTWDSTTGGGQGSVAANLTQTGNALSGTISFTNWCFANGTVAGTLSAEYSIALTLTFVDSRGVQRQSSFSGNVADVPVSATTRQLRMIGDYTGVMNGSCVAYPGGITMDKM